MRPALENELTTLYRYCLKEFGKAKKLGARHTTGRTTASCVPAPKARKCAFEVARETLDEYPRRGPFAPGHRKADGHGHFTVIVLGPYGTCLNDCLGCRPGCGSSFGAACTGSAQDWTRTVGGKRSTIMLLRDLAYRSSSGDPHFKALTRQSFIQRTFQAPPQERSEW